MGRIQLSSDYMDKLDINGTLDFNFMNSLVPYDGDSNENLTNINLNEEINLLENQINSINIEAIPLKKEDFVIVFLAGLVGGICDVVLGKPADGYNGILEKAHEPKINNDFAFGLGKYLKEYDLTNNPIDKNIPNIQVGDHRLFSYGHDLLRVFQTIPLMLNGTGAVGLSGLGGKVILEQSPEKWIEKLEKLNIKPNDPKSYFKLVLILALHLYKDYCSTRSLPIPGSTIIANLNNDTMPEFIDKLSNDMEFNLRTLNGQLLSVASIEILNGIYSFVQKQTQSGKMYTKEQHNEKKEKLLLMSHSVAMIFNMGKVAVTKNPAFINFPQMLRIVKLAWDCCESEIIRNQKAIENTNLNIIKNKMETMNTIIVLEESIYYTKQIDRLIADMIIKFDDINSTRNEQQEKEFNELDNMMLQLKRLNN